jgi:hypothetical protein
VNNAPYRIAGAKEQHTKASRAKPDAALEVLAMGDKPDETPKDRRGIIRGK